MEFKCVPNELRGNCSLVVSPAFWQITHSFSCWEVGRVAVGWRGKVGLALGECLCTRSDSVVKQERASGMTSGWDE